jgi:hypothetical protein
MKCATQKPGCCGSSELAIVASAASWREIFWEKPGMGTKTKNSLNSASTCLTVVDTRRFCAQVAPKLLFKPYGAKPTIGGETMPYKDPDRLKLFAWRFIVPNIARVVAIN